MTRVPPQASTVVGPNNPRVLPCPTSPNCVSSMAEDPSHFVPPLIFHGTQAEALTRLLNLLETLPRCTIVSRSENYIHAECTSRIFRFVDDLELFIDPNHGLIHVRSASRQGYADFGVNRKRVEWLRYRLAGH